MNAVGDICDPFAALGCWNLRKHTGYASTEMQEALDVRMHARQIGGQALISLAKTLEILLCFQKFMAKDTTLVSKHLGLRFKKSEKWRMNHPHQDR